MDNKILIFYAHDRDLFYTPYECKGKLEKLLKDIDRFRRENMIIEDLDELFSLSPYDGDYIEGTKIYVTPFIKEWFGVGAEKFEDSKTFNWIQARLRDRLFDSSLIVYAPGNEGFYQNMSEEDAYKEKIKGDSVIDYEKLKRMLISVPRFHASNIVESHKLCSKVLYNNLRDTDLSSLGVSLSEDYDFYRDLSLKDFFKGLEDFDKNILPTLDSYWEHVFNYCKNHPIDKYYRFLAIYDPMQFNNNYLSCRIYEKELIRV